MPDAETQGIPVLVDEAQLPLCTAEPQPPKPDLPRKGLDAEKNARSREAERGRVPLEGQLRQGDIGDGLFYVGLVVREVGRSRHGEQGSAQVERERRRGDDAQHLGLYGFVARNKIARFKGEDAVHPELAVEGPAPAVAGKAHVAQHQMPRRVYPVPARIRREHDVAQEIEGHRRIQHEAAKDVEGRLLRCREARGSGSARPVHVQAIHRDVGADRLPRRTERRGIEKDAVFGRRNLVVAGRTPRSSSPVAEVRPVAATAYPIVVSRSQRGAEEEEERYSHQGLSAQKVHSVGF